MAVYNGSIGGAAANGSLSPKGRIAKLFSIGYNQEVVPEVFDGREMSYEVGLLSTTAEMVDIYRWGTWRVMDNHEDKLNGFISDKYQYGERTFLGQPSELNLVQRVEIVPSSNGVGIVRESLHGIRVKENYNGLDAVIKVRIPVHQEDLTGKTWGDWTNNGVGGGTTTVLRPRRYPDTHIPRRRDNS
ncbi:MULTISPECIES: hypothetical protein [unclassified Paenibacillus]|uniref:hypothetical protein n=1 Tax=unclassified Paenibacillus TaxID=185978 RepID=UPI00089B7971|nr:MULTISPECIES: hypothetical protein [unclassified Paenibacillus]OMC68634.1 hypothetical protein BK126_12460 [Paenibacillus sp. FSL H7-0326]SDW56670.1 hypothetical protein SAMN05518848_102201 [Paenibacillus sp. PDC88]